MKGPVEKLFDLVQDSFKPFLKGYGVIEKDFQKRGIKDYRLESCLTIEQFEKIIIHTIIYYNNRVLENFPYSDDMMKDGHPQVYGIIKLSMGIVTCYRLVKNN